MPKQDNIITVLREFRRSWPAIKEMLYFFNSIFSPRLDDNSNKVIMSKKEDPYMILGVSPSDDFDKIKAVYKRLVKIYHPDSDTGNEEFFIKIQHAYEQIKKEKEV